MAFTPPCNPTTPSGLLTPANESTNCSEVFGDPKNIHVIVHLSSVSPGIDSLEALGGEIIVMISLRLKRHPPPNFLPGIEPRFTNLYTVRGWICKRLVTCDAVSISFIQYLQSLFSELILSLIGRNCASGAIYRHD